MVSPFSHFLSAPALVNRKGTKGIQRMRQAFLLCVLGISLCVFAVQVTQAQTFPLQVQVSVMPPYSAYLQDYPGAGQQVRVFIINTSRSTYQIRLTGQLTGDNGIEIKTSPNYRPPRPVTIPPGQTLLTRNDLEGLFDLNQVDVTGIDKNLLARGLPLPDGTYQLCIRAYNETATNTAATAFGSALSAEFPLGCSAPIVVRSVEPPILISPLCDADVTATIPQAVVFTWTPPVGVSPASVEYTLRVVELPQENIDPNVFIDAITLPRSGVDVRNLRTSTFLYGPTQPPLQVGKRYAWRVQAIDRSGKLHFQNDGKAPVCAFTYGNEPAPKLPILPIASTDSSSGKKYVKSQTFVLCQCNAQLSTEEGGIAENKAALAKKQITIAGFTVDLSPTVSLDGNNLLQGTGTVPIPYAGSGYLKIRVRLNNIQCNASGQVINGTVRGLNNLNPSLLPGYDQPNFSGLNLSPGDVSKISETISGLKDKVVQSAKDWKNSVGWEMPLGVYTSKVDVAITNITFEPKKAYFDANLWLKVPSAQFGGVPLSAANVCLTPDKPICGDMTLYLGADMPLSTYVSLKGAVANMNDKPSGNLDFQKITSVNLTNWEFKTFHIVAGMKPPGLKRADNDKEVELTLTYDSPKADLTDWTASVEFPEFYVTALSKDFTFSMDGKPGIYDHSEQPDAYTNLLPNDYPMAGQKPGAEWTGLFFPKLKIKTTLLKALNNGKETSVSVENMIYDDKGFTGSIVAGPSIIELGSGSLDGWFCSADQLRLNIKLSKFESSTLTGRVVMPIFKYTDEKQMEKASIWPYTCTLSKDDKANSSFSYQFTIIPPKGEASVALWAAKLSVLDGTNITVGNKGGSFNASVTLNAKLSIDAKIISPGMTVTGMKLQSSPTDGSSYFTPGLIDAKFASPQKSLLADTDEGGFPITIKAVSLTNVQGEKSKYDFKFTGDVTLMDGNIQTSITPYVRFKISFGANKRPDWGFDKVGVDKATIHGNLSFVRIDGAVDFFSGNTENGINYGDGFKGDINMTVMGLKGTVAGYFGRVNGFRYWQVGGLFDLPSPVPVPGTPLTFQAFGGGAFHNMEKVTQLDAAGKPKVGAPVSFKPHQGINGFEVATEVTLQTKDLLDMNGVMTATVNTSNGFHLSDLRLDLNAALMGPEPNKALATGIGGIEINFDQGYFDATFALNANYASPGNLITATGSGDLGMHISFPPALGTPTENQDLSKQKPGSWYFYLGLPDATPCDNMQDCFDKSERIKLSVSALGTSFIFGAYFVMYNGIKPDGVTILPPPPWGISAGDLAALGYKGGMAAGPSALAFGAGFIKHDEASFGPFEIDFDMNLGFDLALSKVTSTCGNGQVPGINGWYANGQLYASLALTLGINIDIWIYSGYLELLKVQATALLEGGMINPIWVHGSILLRYRALGGRIKGHTTFELWYNKDGQCKPAFEQPNPFADLPIIAGLSPENNSKNVSVITPYYAEFSYPVRTLIQINDVDPQTRQPISTFRTFKLDFIGGTPTNPFVTKQVQASSTNPGCQLDNSGKLRFGSDPDGGGNFNVSFFRDVTLPPNAKFEVSLTVGVKLLNKATGTYDTYMYPQNNPKPVTDTKTYTFSTGECVSSLTKEGEVPSVAYSFPFEGQRYFTVGDGGIFGYVELSSNFGCCLDKIQSDKYYKLSVRYTALKGNKFDKNDPSTVWTNNNVKFDGKLLRFGIPINFLQKKTLYRLEIYREPSDALVAEQKKLIDDQKGKIRKDLDKQYGDGGKAEFGFSSDKGATASTAPGAGLLGGKVANVNNLAQAYNAAYIDQSLQKFTSSAVNVTNQKASTATDIKMSKGKSDEVVDVKTQLEQPVYSYYFQTSQYNTLAEKLKATQFLTSEQKTLRTDFLEVYTLPIQAAEGFDTYELNWKALPNNAVLPPLVLQQVFDTTNPWFASFMQPMVNLVNSLASYKKTDGNILFKSAANTQTEAVDYAQLLRQMVKYTPAIFNSAQPPISKKDLKGLAQN